MPTVVRTFPILPGFVFLWMMMRAGLVFTPDVGALAVAHFQWLARFEEHKFANSSVAAEYAEYAAKTGRLLPRLTRQT